ncbi:PAS domain-containing protein [Streptomyces sp. NPDC050625]|uniref:helix-turn-helix transcriptional regulator n=1 Tax=Streptomyces sp. NPDC050625 TaxID=3154629 RepID=UPI00343F96B9
MECTRNAHGWFRRAEVKALVRITVFLPGTGEISLGLTNKFPGSHLKPDKAATGSQQTYRRSPAQHGRAPSAPAGLAPAPFHHLEEVPVSSWTVSEMLSQLFLAPTGEPWHATKPGDDVSCPLLDRSGIGVATLDPGLRLVEATTEFGRHFAVPPSTLRGRAFLEMLHPGVRDRAREEFTGLATDGRTRILPGVAALGARAHVFSCEVTGVAVRDDGRGSSLLVLLRPQDPPEDAAGAPGDGERAVHRSKSLTELDARILEGVAVGASNVALASKLCLSRQGIEYRVTSLLRRMRAPNRAALVSRAHALGLFAPGSWPPKVRPDCVRH